MLGIANTVPITGRLIAILKKAKFSLVPRALSSPDSTLTATLSRISGMPCFMSG